MSWSECKHSNVLFSEEKLVQKTQSLCFQFICHFHSNFSNFSSENKLKNIKIMETISIQGRTHKKSRQIKPDEKCRKNSPILLLRLAALFFPPPFSLHCAIRCTKNVIARPTGDGIWSKPLPVSTDVCSRCVATIWLNFHQPLPGFRHHHRH